ncbi:MAG: transcriptional regulator [Gammaproteobacteria bacterium]|nr:transcriptional regulator [Gammaproteobacteria bacterium]
MEQYPRRLLTVVTEAVLERDLLGELEALGVRGYTITDARGRGSRGTRQSDWAQDGNIRIEIVCEPALAARVAARLRERYYDHYAMILFMQDVSVLRPEKF